MVRGSTHFDPPNSYVTNCCVLAISSPYCHGCSCVLRGITIPNWAAGYAASYMAGILIQDRAGRYGMQSTRIFSILDAGLVNALSGRYTFRPDRLDLLLKTPKPGQIAGLLIPLREQRCQILYWKLRFLDPCRTCLA